MGSEKKKKVAFDSRKIMDKYIGMNRSSTLTENAYRLSVFLLSCTIMLQNTHQLLCYIIRIISYRSVGYSSG